MPRFWRCYNQLPKDVRALADRCYAQLKADPRHPSWHFKKVDTIWSARVRREPDGWWRVARHMFNLNR